MQDLRIYSVTCKFLSYIFHIKNKYKRSVSSSVILTIKIYIILIQINFDSILFIF